VFIVFVYSGASVYFIYLFTSCCITLGCSEYFKDMQLLSAMFRPVSDDYLFCELLELVDLDFKAHSDSSGCSQFHFMPRFVRDLAGMTVQVCHFISISS
jgi:hypothetical protein